MAKAKVGLYLRYRQEGKQSPYRPVLWDAKKRLRPFWCMVRGVEEHHPEGSYHLRYGVNGKQVWEPVRGADPTALRNSRAHDLNNPKDSSSQRLVESHTAVEVPVPGAAKDRLKLDDAIRIYLTTGKAAEKDWRRHTLQCYTLALKLFTESCKKTHMDEIDGDDLRAFKVFLRKQKTSIGKYIDPRTVYNHFLNTVSFLNTYKLRNLIPQNEWPTYEEKKVVAYDPEVLAHVLQFSDVDETDVLEFFLGVNFRNGEGAHVEWPDINLRTKEVKVYSKRERYGWQVKDSEQRNIGINDKLADRLAARHLRHPGNGLVFPNSHGNPDTHLLRIIKNVAWRAGLNCGQCVGTHQRKRMSCAEGPVCRKWILHTMRKTWASFQDRIRTDFATIQTELGHSSPATTRKYLAAQDHNSPRRREQINAAAALVQPKSQDDVTVQ
jgi:integrase/recombinase XerD